MATKGEVTLYDALDSISGTVKARGAGLDDLIFILERAKATNLSDLADKQFHQIFETLFKCALTEKQSFFSGKKTTASAAATRLSKCAEALRLALQHGAPNLKRKTVSAVIDHVTQTLPAPAPERGFVKPLQQDYIKSIVAVLSHQSNVEHMCTSKAAIWSDCMDFCLDALSCHLDTMEPDARASPGPGASGQTFSAAFSTGRSSNTSQKGLPPGQLPRGSFQELLHCVYLLLSPPNAPINYVSRKASNILLQILQLRRQGLSQVTQYAFASLNLLLASIQTDDLDLTGSLARDVVPLISHWWQGRSASKDEMLNSVRDEMLKTIFGIHLHLERLVAQDGSVLDDIQDLSDTLWLEYVRRDERAQLQLDDLTFSQSHLSSGYFALSTFGLRSHNQDGERKWAILQNIAFLERILLTRSSAEDRVYDQPRQKRRRTTTDRLGERLESADTRTATLQLVPFLLDLKCSVSPRDLITESDTTSSWAMVAYASYLLHHTVIEHDLRSLWQAVSRAISLPSTCRAACHLLSVMLRVGIRYHRVSSEITSIVTTADANGPALLVDSSVDLMAQLLYLRNAKVPSASQQTAHHIVRWVFLRWNPANSTYASLHSGHVQPLELANLLRACCGASRLEIPSAQRSQVSGGPICQAWAVYSETCSTMRYLLHLPEMPETETSTTELASSGSISTLASSEPVRGNNSANHASRKLILELFSTKLEELKEVCCSWHGSDGSVQMSPERLRSLFCACIVGTIMAPLLLDLNSRQSQDIETTIFDLLESSLAAALSIPDNQSLFDILTNTVARYIPTMDTRSLNSLVVHSSAFLRLLAVVARAIHERSIKLSSRQPDLMDLDDEFESQESRVTTISKTTELPRRNAALLFHQEAFRHATSLRLLFLELVHRDNTQAGLIPADFLGYLQQLQHEDFLLSADAISEIFNADFIVSPDDALHLIEKCGEIIAKPEYTCCEVAHSVTLKVLEGLILVWLDEKHEIASCVGDLYHYFVKSSLPKNSLSPRSQTALSSLLLCLLHNEPQYGTNLGLSSCRTTLLSILQQGIILVKHYIALRLPDIFGLFVLKTHDDVFVDVLASLPTDPEAIEGLAFRLFVLAELACRWPTLLRRCVYHIFETPGNVKESAEYATRCLSRISSALNLPSPKELFKIFSPQLLYTWLEDDSIGEMPFAIFGFESLEDMLRASQAEAAALMLMRGQENEAEDLARRLGISVAEMVKRGFSHVIAYAIAYDASSSSTGPSSAEARVRKLLGKEPYLASIYANFADIVALLMDLFDQEDPIEKYWAKDRNFVYASDVMEEMKRLSHSSVALPANQQPMFKAKFLLRELFNLCNRTEYELQNLWTPALVVSVARRLFNSVLPALGSLHACSALRKVRVLICLAGPAVLEQYPLEMLLHSIRPFIVDHECADDAMGISQYLISRGSSHLEQVPPFFAGYALSTLASLRVFLESSQSSTTQESQFKATMNKAQQFHAWFSKFLAQYESPRFVDETQRSSFKTITQSASHIRSSGNAERGTAESTLLLEILDDDTREQKLLNDAARDLALGMLCGEFTVPRSTHQDVIDNDTKAIQHGGLVWKSCKAHALSDEYLAWAGRVVGRSFAASGEVQAELLRESQLAKYIKLAPGTNDSEKGLLTLLQRLTLNKDSFTAGLAESALRTIVSEAVAQGDDLIVTAAQQTLPEPLYISSEWQSYQTPPSDTSSHQKPSGLQALSQEQIEQPRWPQDLAGSLVQAVPTDIVLRDLLPVVECIKDFAEEALPFIVHLALYSQIDKQKTVKHPLSEAIKRWFDVDSEAARGNQKHLVNALLYLRTQQYPKESSIADRSAWLDVEHSLTASVACKCGMHKTALLFTEIAASQTTRTPRRSSVVRETVGPDVLLEIFENIDDPDAYYGLTQPPEFTNVLARLEYEKDGLKSLAFRSAQLDTHLKHDNQGSQADVLSLVKTVSTLGLSGLAHYLRQTQENTDENASEALESTFSTARRLNTWNLPTPESSENHAVTIYKAFQTVQQATDAEAVRAAVYAGFGQTMRSLTERGLKASDIRHHLGALAALSELDDLSNIADYSELESMIQTLEERGQWMRHGRYDDISRLLSCRETTMGLFSSHTTIRASSSLSVARAKEMEVQSMLLSSKIYRFHHATQESLNLATSLNNLVAPCEELGLTVDAAVRIESANSLWDQGEMSSSIRILQAVDDSTSLNKQSIPVLRSDVLSKIGHQISVARLEKPHDIQKKYLEPALRELKGKNKGKDASQAFHQFAMFCDEQLQSSDGQEDLARLQYLRQGKSDEVTQLQALLSNAKNSQMKAKYQSDLGKAEKWLQLDEQELRRVEKTRAEFVRLSLENYLLSLVASDEYNNDALRFTALWLEHADDDAINEVVGKHLEHVATRKFAPLINQLSSRLQNVQNPFQKLLMGLVYSICVDHPYHGMYHIWSGCRSRTNDKDEIAVLRQKATDKISKWLEKNQDIGGIWNAIDRTSLYYHRLAKDQDSSKYKAGNKINLKDSGAGNQLAHALNKYQIPPPTMQLELNANRDYSKVPIITMLEPQMSIASGLSAPKIITAVGSDGRRYRQLVKGGNDDLRQDAIMEQVFAAVSSLLKLHRETRQRNLGIRTYKVLPLTASSGLIEFVPNTIPLHDYLMPAHERYFPKDFRGSQCRKELSNAQGKSVEARISAFRKVTERFHPVMKYFFFEYFVDPDEWFSKRTAYTRTTAVISMLGHVLGVGDRHGHNVLLDYKTGEVVHIDLGIAFETGRILPVPELVPFRLTRDIEDGMGITKTEGVFRRCCEFTLDALREETYSIMTILDVLRYDPLYSWSISAVRLAKLQNVRDGEGGEGGSGNQGGDETEAAGRKKRVNEPSEADRALEVVRKKLSKTLSVTATVNDLINQASDERNLAVLFPGWAAYA